MPMPVPARPPASFTEPGAITTDRTNMTNRTTLAQLREMDAAQANPDADRDRARRARLAEEGPRAPADAIAEVTP